MKEKLKLYYVDMKYIRDLQSAPKKDKIHKKDDPSL